MKKKVNDKKRKRAASPNVFDRIGDESEDEVNVIATRAPNDASDGDLKPADEALAFAERVKIIIAIAAKMGRLPKRSEDYENASFISRQRDLYRRDQLSDENVALMLSIPGFEWGSSPDKTVKSNLSDGRVVSSSEEKVGSIVSNSDSSDGRAPQDWRTMDIDFAHIWDNAFGTKKSVSTCHDILVRIVLSNPGDSQHAPFLSAKAEFLNDMASLKSFHFEEISPKQIRQMGWSPKQVTDWLLGANIHIITTHIHQG